MHMRSHVHMIKIVCVANVISSFTGSLLSFFCHRSAALDLRSYSTPRINWRYLFVFFMCVCAFMNMCLRVCVRVFMYLRVCVLRACVCLSVCVRVCVSVSVYLCTCAYVYEVACMCLSVYVCCVCVVCMFAWHCVFLFVCAFVLTPAHLHIQKVECDYPGPGDEIELCVYQAANIYYYKYSVGGMNVIPVSIYFLAYFSPLCACGVYA